MKQKSINALAWSVMWRIMAVIAYYISLILLSILIIVSVYYFSVYLFWPLLSYMNGFYIIMIIVAWAGLCCLALMFAAFLAKPLFSSTESKELNNAIEIEREECPKLFDVISDIVKQTGTKMPKHVYLSPDTNACVFFDSSFWSIFLPIRKNLKIGLGLFNGLSVEELKSILAHEFGHFSQSSMKVGSSVYVINQVLYNMTYKRDGWDDLLDTWSTTNSDGWIANAFAFWGLLTRKITNWVKRGNETMYKFVQHEYMNLSRQMEYEADDIACKCVGKDCFISAMYKTDINSRNLHFFTNIMNDLIADKKKVKNIFEAIEITNNTYYKDDPTLISYDHPLVESLLVESRIRVNDSLSSHPLLADRIENAKKNPSKDGVKAVPSWELVPDEIAVHVSSTFYWAYEDYMKCQEITNDEYASWLNQYLPQHYMPNLFVQFFGRRITPFDFHEVQDDNVDFPFTQQNRMIVDEYQVTLNDWDLIERIRNGTVNTKDLYINGEPLTASDFPVDEYKKHLSELSPLVSDLDKQVYHYMASHCQEEVKEQLNSAYYLYFYADHTINGCLSSLINVSNQTREKLVGIFNAYGGFNANAVYDLIEKYVISFNQHLKEIEDSAIAHVTDKGYLVDLKGVLAAYTEVENLSKTDYLNRILVSLPQELIEIHKMLIVKAQQCLSDIAQDIINRNKVVKENPDDKAPSFTCKIESITIDYVEDINNSETVAYLFASFFVLLMIVLYFMFYPRETVINTESEETTTSSYPSPDNEVINLETNDPVELMKLKRDFTELSLCADKLTDVWAKCFIPEGLSYGKVYSSDVDAYEIHEDVLSPPYRIYFFTKDFFGAYDDYQVNEVLKDCDKFLKLESVPRTGVWKKGNYSSNVTCYQKNLLYDTNPKTIVDIYILHPLGLECLCYFIYKREKVVDSPMYGILTSVRFEQHRRQ